MTDFICSPGNIIPGIKKEKTYLFLAGPIQGVHDWQGNDIPRDLGSNVTLISPRRESLPIDWDEQVKWETEALRICDAVLFWIPTEEEHIEGRDYAQTTKIELMESLARGKKVFLGIDPSIHTRRYLIEKAKAYGVRAVHQDLASLISEVRDWLEKRNEEKERIFFTSDTHFGSTRALELSKRPFLSVSDMGWKMVENWNKVVRPKDTVYHLGDFGDRSWIKYLNGQVRFLPGNYEKNEISAHWTPSEFAQALLGMGFSHVYDPGKMPSLTVDDYRVHLVHEPGDLKTLTDYELQSPVFDHLGKDSRYALFGHIHGRQRIKKFGIDVGVDANNFTPMSEDDVKFYLGAIEKGYYDDNVWC